MKAVTILTLVGIVLLVLLRLNGVTTGVTELDTMVLLLMESMHLA